MPSLPQPPQPGRPVSAAWGRQLLDYCRWLTPRGGKGVLVDGTGANITLSARVTARAGAAEKYPLQVINASEGTDDQVRVRYGTVRNLVPKIGSNDLVAEIDDSPVLAISGPGVVYVEVAWPEEDAVPSGVDIKFAASLPSNTASAAFRTIAAIAWDASNDAGSRITSISPNNQGSLDVARCGDQFYWGSAG